MTLNFKKIELSASKNAKALDHAKSQLKDHLSTINRLEEENSTLHSRLQDLSLRLEEREREVTDLKYQTEKDDFQLKLKEETLSQTRDQLKRAE
jgi:uncharacterized protein (UPF0335 family)